MLKSEETGLLPGSMQAPVKCPCSKIYTRAVKQAPLTCSCSGTYILEVCRHLCKPHVPERNIYRKLSHSPENLPVSADLKRTRHRKLLRPQIKQIKNRAIRWLCLCIKNQFFPNSRIAPCLTGPTKSFNLKPCLTAAVIKSLAVSTASMTVFPFANSAVIADE